VTATPTFDVVIPTVGRPSLRRVLAAVVWGRGPAPARIVVVDDRPAGTGPPLRLPAALPVPVCVLRSYASGPAGARNVGWSAGGSDWVAFLDDDVEPPYDWLAALARDLLAVHEDPSVAGSQGRVLVPLPQTRRPSDWERDVGGLAAARWITADLAYRRTALHAVDGFDERFRRAYREDSDAALQVVARVGDIVVGTREVVHPVVPAPWTVSVRRQRGNHDDALMRRRYGRSWRHDADAFPTRLARHVATASCAVGAVAALAARRRLVALACAVAWGALTVEFGVARVRPASRRPSELGALAATTVIIPPIAVWHRVRGELRVLRDLRAGLAPSARVGPRSVRRAVLFDRDGTLVEDVPYNGDPELVRPVDGAADALADLRARGVRLAVVTNQSGVARGYLTLADVQAVHDRIDAEVGPFDQWSTCPHGPEDGCRCRKPAPGLVVRAAKQLGIHPGQCVVIGDTEADVAAARAAGARGILVANARTRADEVQCAPESARTLRLAVDRVLESV
jgi:histidinol-phosphate phosphatase family protein